jgi:hypothetical protein
MVAGKQKERRKSWGCQYSIKCSCTMTQLSPTRPQSLKVLPPPNNNTHCRSSL